MHATWQTTDGTIRLFHADCRAVLATMPDDSVDMVMTSPPYNIAGGTHAPSGRYKNAPLNISGDWYNDAMPEADYQQWLNDIIGECLRVSRGLVWMNHKVRYADRQAMHPARFITHPIYSEVIWERSGATAFNARKFAPSHEGLWAFGTPHYWDDACNTLLTVWRIHQDCGEHPCSYPVELPLRTIRASSPVGGTVLDPFSGSATTGIAAMRLGRSYIGTEKERRYFDIGVRRLEGESVRTPLFASPPLAVQQTLTLE